MNALTRAVRAGREAEILQPSARAMGRVNSSAGGVANDVFTGAAWVNPGNRRFKRRRRSTRWD